ncbi:MAG: polymerase sigma-70 factor, subfamily [Acidobacteriota bacterium]|jgi:RNA polymerase sigma-70 factor (ECF subfamily)|nr:polymerase sigma-70 factor, subfamily [Acidobacteriota bacterium]
MTIAEQASQEIERVFRSERQRALATLIRLLGGDFDLAEDALQEAFAEAVTRWGTSGVPAHPRAWLVSTARHKGLNRLRRQSRFEEKRRALAWEGPRFEPPDVSALEGGYDGELGDDRLRLIFTCCHPALAVEAQVALTLRTLCGLETDEIARAFLVPVPTLAQRLVRAKQKIRMAGIPYRVPPPELVRERLDAVLCTIYLVFNEGYAATAGPALVRVELCLEAIRLGRLLLELLPEETEARALLALMLLHHARRAARLDRGGELVLLEEQDRSLWDGGEIAEGLGLVEDALRRGGARPYALQAAIAALHARAATAPATDWRQMAELYHLLVGLQPSPVVELNRAVAVAQAYGEEAGLRLLDDLDTRGALPGYHLLPAARADLLRRLGRAAEAADAYRRALALASNPAEQRFLARRLRQVEG